MEGEKERRRGGRGGVGPPGGNPIGQGWLVVRLAPVPTVWRARGVVGAVG